MMVSNVKGMMGLGDNVYQRSFLTNTSEVTYLETPWPELYADLPHVHCVKSQTKLRTQYKNICATNHNFANFHGRINKQIRYGSDGIVNGMTRCFGYRQSVMDLPDFGRLIPIDKPYIVVRPVTVRNEWKAESRNPNPEYIQKAALSAMEAGVLVVSVADIDEVNEYAVGALPPCDIAYNKGELSVTELLSLTQHASGVIGGVGWLLPVSIAQNVKSLIVCGGYGGYNQPNKLKPSHACDNVTFAVPDNMCDCTLMNHKCNKSISDFDSVLTKWMSEL